MSKDWRDYSIGEEVGGILVAMGRDAARVWRWNRARRLRRRAADDAQRALDNQIRMQELAREEAAARLEDVKSQMIKGEARNATPDEARSALGGRGGRRNSLDKQWF